MEARLDYQKIAPAAFTAMVGMERYLHQCGLEKRLLELVKLRASQINGCAYCIDMHTKDLRAAGETEQRIYCLSVWQECPFYTDRERAALDWTEAVTLRSQTHASDDAYARVRAVFSEKELVDLTWAVATINAWNRVAISMRAVPGSYEARAVK